MSAVDVTPWGERWDALAEVVLNDPSAPPVLQLAAIRFRMIGDDSELRSLVADAVALHESDQSNEVAASPRPEKRDDLATEGSESR